MVLRVIKNKQTNKRRWGEENELDLSKGKTDFINTIESYCIYMVKLRIISNRCKRYLIAYLITHLYKTDSYICNGIKKKVEGKNSFESLYKF